MIDLLAVPIASLLRLDFPGLSEAQIADYLRCSAASAGPSAGALLEATAAQLTPPREDQP